LDRPLNLSGSTLNRVDLFLVSLSITLSLLTGAILGVFVAMKRSGFREPIINLISLIGYVIPVFWIGHLGKQYIVIIANNNAEEIVGIAYFLAFFAGSWRLLGSSMPRIVRFGFRYGFIWFSSFIVQKLILTLPEYMRKEEIGGRPFSSFGFESG